LSATGSQSAASSSSSSAAEPAVREGRHTHTHTHTQGSQPEWVHGCGEIIKSSWLTKQGGGTSAFGHKNWKLRWFVLRDNGILTYHKNSRPDAKPLGIIDLTDSYEAKREAKFDDLFTDVCCFSVDVPGRKYCFVA
jgi:hypothetical protein